MRFFIILIIVTLATMAAIPSHAATQTYLDGDAPTTTLVQLKPGDYAKFTMPYDVTFSSVHGDDENKDSELMFSTIHVKVGLTNDKAELQIFDSGKVVYDEVLAEQHGFVWSQNEKGSATVELILDCYGNLKIYANDKLAYTVNGLSTTTTLDVLGDKDASLTSSGQYYKCNTTLPEGYASSSSSVDFKMAAVAVSAVVLLGAGLALAFRG